MGPCLHKPRVDPFVLQELLQLAVPTATKRADMQIL